MSTTRGPLAGLRVLDLGHYVAGPLAGVFLADQGADVVRVVRPGVAVWDAHTETVLARGKRTLVADLHDEADRAVVFGLAVAADVVIENFRPGVMDRLGLPIDLLRSQNPGLVVVSMPAYSRHDPRADQVAWDSTISAACGLFTDLSVAGSAAGLPPTYTSLPLPSVYAGLWGAIGAVAAIHGRLASGRGDHLEVPLLDAAMSAAAGVVFQTEDQPARYNVPPIKRSVLDAISMQRVPDRVAALTHRAAAGMMPPFFRTYRCEDGAGLFVCAIDNAGQIGKLLACVGISEGAAALGFVDGDVIDLPATATNLNAYRGTSKRWRGLQHLLERRFATASADEWANRLAEAGVPAVRQRSTAQWAALPVMTRSGVLVEDPAGATRPAPQVDVRGAGVATASTPAPAAPHEPTSWLSARTFVGPEPSDAPAAPPLAGVRVLDLANVIAGPAAGRTLAELGAEVLHVSAVTPRMGPRMTLFLGLEVNQGKRSLACDLHTPEGHDVLGRLLPDSDVVLYNKLPAQAERLGVAPEDVHALNDRAVVTAVTAYGGTRAGGWEDRPAYDPVIQALTGVMQRFGGADTPAVHGIASCIDYFTGFSAAFGTIVALLARSQGATHLVARTSLVRTAAWVQVTHLGRPDEPHTAGLLERGPHALDRIYRTRDGWVHVGAPEASWPDVAARAGTDLAAADATAWLTRQLRRRNTDEAVAWGRGLGCAVQQVLSASALRGAATSPAGRDATAPSGRVVRIQHPAGELFWVPETQWLRSTALRQQPLSPAPKPGQHTSEVLAELGLNEASRADLFDRGIVSSGWATGPRYLPG